MERVLGVKLRGKDIGNPVRVHAWRLTLAVGRPQKVKEHVVHPMVFVRLYALPLVMIHRSPALGNQSRETRPS